MAAAAERMEDEVLALDRDLTGRDHRLSGPLRVRAFFDVVGDGLARERDLFEGRRGGSADPGAATRGV
jgi:hypothetical protein